MAKDESMFPKFCFQESVKRGTKGGMQGFRVNRLRHDAIGLQEVYYHVPLATVADEVV